MTVYEKISQLCREKGVSLWRMASDIGLGKSTVSAWRYGSSPRLETLKLIADYFGVSASSLLGEPQPLGADRCSELSDSELGFGARLLNIAAALTDDARDDLMFYAEILAQRTSGRN